MKAFESTENLSCVPLGHCGGMNRKKIAYSQMKYFFLQEKENAYGKD